MHTATMASIGIHMALMLMPTLFIIFKDGASIKATTHGLIPLNMAITTSFSHIELKNSDNMMMMMSDGRQAPSMAVIAAFIPFMR